VPFGRHPVSSSSYEAGSKRCIMIKLAIPRTIATSGMGHHQCSQKAARPCSLSRPTQKTPAARDQGRPPSEPGPLTSSSISVRTFARPYRPRAQGVWAGSCRRGDGFTSVARRRAEGKRGGGQEVRRAGVSRSLKQVLRLPCVLLRSWCSTCVVAPQLAWP
jgi:hypothetical protein